jgi:IS1 family transposase
VTTQETLSVAEVLALLENWRPEDAKVAQSASRILRSVGSAALLDVHRGRVAVFVETYRLRVSRNTGRWSGDRELLATLENYPETHVRSARASVGIEWVLLWFDDRLSRIVGCITGTRRLKSLYELRAQLEHHEIPPGVYGLGHDQDESFCMVMEDERWHVYYSERGKRVSEAVFASESDACEELLKRVLNDGAIQAWKARGWK